MAKKTDSRRVFARSSILATFPGLIAAITITITVLISTAILAVSFSEHSKREKTRIDQLRALIAPDLAWRETDRLEHWINVELDGNGLVLDAGGLPIAGNDSLLAEPRFEVRHEGRPVGHIIAPDAVKFILTIPYWLIVASGVFGIFLCVAVARLLANRLHQSISELADYAKSLDPRLDNGGMIPIEFTELAHLRARLVRSVRRLDSERARLNAIAFEDPLTQLPNLNKIRSVVNDTIGQATVDVPAAFLFLDLNGYIRATETLGPEGDSELLAAAIARIEGVLEDMPLGLHRPVLASLQSDDFALYLPQCPQGREDISVLVRRLRTAFDAPLAVGDRLVTLGISGGIAMLPEDAMSADEALRHSGMALQKARQNERGGFQFYAPSFDRVAKGRFQLETELRRAVHNGEFVPFFQPKIDFATGKIVGAEALARWRRDRDRIVMPGAFIGIAEEIGLIEEIGRQILTASCRSATDWMRLGYDISIAVNVSPRQFERRNFTDDVIKVLKRTGLPPKRLELEITENMAVEDPQKVADVMRPLRAMGVSLAIDDFGTGHSNLAMLTRLPFDVFKIDRQFISALQSDRQAPAIVEMILAMAETLGLKTVAEGVETRQQADFLRRRGCTLGQGFLYSPGIPQQEFLGFLKSWPGHREGTLQQSVG